MSTYYKTDHQIAIRGMPPGLAKYHVSHGYHFRNDCFKYFPFLVETIASNYWALFKFEKT